MKSRVAALKFLTLTTTAMDRGTKFTAMYSLTCILPSLVLRVTVIGLLLAPLGWLMVAGPKPNEAGAPAALRSRPRPCTDRLRRGGG
jgi:hypothetical protein